jgi:hypothetical protein
MSNSPSYSPSAMLDFPGHQAGAQPIQLLSRRWGARIGLVIFFLPLGLWLLGSGVKIAIRHPSDFSDIGILLILGLTVLAFTVWRFWTELTRRVALYDAGLEVIQRGKRSAIRFEHMEEVWLTAQRAQTGGLIGMGIRALIERMRKDKSLDARGVSLQMRVVGAGTTVKLTSLDKGVFAAYQEVIRRVNPRLVQEARTRIDSGNSVAFNKIKLSREGLAFGKKIIRLDQIEKLSIKDGKLSVKVKNKWFASGQRVARTPNLYVLTELVAQMSNGTIQMDVSMGMNLASSCVYV